MAAEQIIIEDDDRPPVYRRYRRRGDGFVDELRRGTFPDDTEIDEDTGLPVVDDDDEGWWNLTGWTASGQVRTDPEDEEVLGDLVVSIPDQSVPADRGKVRVQLTGAVAALVPASPPAKAPKTDADRTPGAWADVQIVDPDGEATTIAVYALVFDADVTREA